MNNNMKFEEMITFLFGEEELKEMKERAAKKAAIDQEIWKKELQEIMDDISENDGIIENKEVDMKHTVLMDTRDFDRKPSDKEIRAKGGITETLPKNPMTLTIEELADYVVNKGRTFKADYQTGTKKDTFVSSSLVAIDVDNGCKINGVKTKVSDEEYVSIEDFICACGENDIQPALMYTTFSHTEEWHRFRAIFQLDKTITSIAEMDMIYNTLQSILPGADRAVKTVSMIHGGKDFILMNPAAVIKANDYIPKNISQATIAAMDDNVANIKEVKRTTKESGEVTKDNLITPALIARYGNKSFESIEDLKQHLLSINLADLLRVRNPSKFNCIFHTDKKPSAGIIQINGTYLYNCLGGCEHGKKDIYDIVAQIKGFKGSQAEMFIKSQRYLMKQLNIKLVNEEWMDAQFALIRNNRYLLTTKQINKETYPALAPRMRYITELLDNLLNHCEAMVMSYPSKDEHGQALFFISHNQLAEKLGKYKVMADGTVIYNSKTIKTQLAELTMLGLIRRVSDEEVERVAPARFKMSLKHKIEKNLIHSVQYYSIPLWNTALLLEANSIKERASKAGITSVGMTQRAASAIEKKISTKVEYKETEASKENINTLIAWAKRTMARKGIFSKDDFMSYAKKQGIGTRYAASILPVVVAQLELEKIVIKNEDIKKYSLSKNALRKTGFKSKDR